MSGVGIVLKILSKTKLNNYIKTLQFKSLKNYE